MPTEKYTFKRKKQIRRDFKTTKLKALKGTIYLKIRQRDGIHEVEAKSNAKEVLQNPDPSTKTKKMLIFDGDTNR